MKPAIVITCLAALLLAPWARAGEAPPEPKPESDLDLTWKTACEWGVGSAAERVRAARVKLIAMGEPALRRAIERLATTDGLEMESAQAVILGIGAASAIPLIEAAENETLPDQVRREAMSLLSGLNQKGQLSPEAKPRAEKAVLANTQSAKVPVRLRALLVSSEFGLREAIPRVIELVKDPAETVRRGAAMMLGKFGGEEAVEPLIALLHDRLMTVRFPAQDALGQIGATAVPRMKVALEKEADPVARRHLLVALGATGDRGVEETLGRYLQAQDPVDRGFALRGFLALLEARRAQADKMAEGPEKAQVAEELKGVARRFAAFAADDPHPFVQAVRCLLAKTTDAILAAPAAKAGEKK
jgi:HEAT repeat protein